MHSNYATRWLLKGHKVAYLHGIEAIKRHGALEERERCNEIIMGYLVDHSVDMTLKKRVEFIEHLRAIQALVYGEH